MQEDRIYVQRIIIMYVYETIQVTTEYAIPGRKKGNFENFPLSFHMHAQLIQLNFHIFQKLISDCVVLLPEGFLRSFVSSTSACWKDSLLLLTLPK